jgi:hypothetical protein
MVSRHGELVMTDTLAPEFVAQLLETARVVETNSQLLIAELRAARAMADQTAATLSLVVGLVANASEMNQSFVLNRLVQDLLTCADQPALAIRIAGCDAEAIDPPMLRAAAARLSGDELAVLATTAVRRVTH